MYRHGCNETETSCRFISPVSFFNFEGRNDRRSNRTHPSGKSYTIRVGSVITDYVAERTTVSLKQSDSLIDCSSCVLPTRVHVQIPNALDNSTNPSVDGESSERSEESSVNGYAPQSGATIRNRAAELRDDVFPCRDVSRTLRMQLVAARNNRETPIDRRALREADLYLRRHSAKPFPTSIAAFPGLGSEPFFLYRCISFDRIHVEDSGIIRDVQEHIHKFAYVHDLPAYRYVGNLNVRYMDIAKLFGLRRMRLFHPGGNAQQAGMTGLVRRQSLPFMWVCLMGVCDDEPDEDPVLQCVLRLDGIYREICGWTRPDAVPLWSDEHLTDLQKRCFSVGKEIATLFDIPIRTKLHRFMRHTKEDIADNGDPFFTSTEESERIHKVSRSAYEYTNRRSTNLAHQALKRRTH